MLYIQSKKSASVSRGDLFQKHKKNLNHSKLLTGSVRYPTLDIIHQTLENYVIGWPSMIKEIFVSLHKHMHQFTEVIKGNSHAVNMWKYLPETSLTAMTRWDHFWACFIWIKAKCHMYYEKSTPVVCQLKGNYWSLAHGTMHLSRTSP